MHELYELKDMLCKELKEYGEKGELTAGSLDTIDKLAHAMKNLDRVIEAYEDDGEYSGRSYPDGMGGSYARGRYSREGRSYASGRMNARRDSMGRYSRDDGMIEELRDLIKDAPNEAIKRDIQRLVDKMEQM
jgi:hypothetical protein